MSAEAWLFLFAVVLAAVLLFTAVFYIIMFSDLECDYLNPIDLCNKMNQFVLPEMGAHMFYTKKGSKTTKFQPQPHQV